MPNNNGLIINPRNQIISNFLSISVYIDFADISIEKPSQLWQQFAFTHLKGTRTNSGTCVSLQYLSDNAYGTSAVRIMSRTLVTHCLQYYVVDIIPNLFKKFKCVGKLQSRARNTLLAVKRLFHTWSLVVVFISQTDYNIVYWGR